MSRIKSGRSQVDGTGSLGHRVSWVIFHVRVTRSSFWPDVRPEFFRISKNAQNAKRPFEMLAPDINTLTCLRTLSRLEYPIRYLTEYSSSKKLDSHTSTHKSTFGLHYRTCRVTGSTGSPGRRIPGSLGHKMRPSSTDLPSLTHLAWDSRIFDESHALTPHSGNLTHFPAQRKTIFLMSQVFSFCGEKWEFSLPCYFYWHLAC